MIHRPRALRNARPTEVSELHYDAIVIGAGQAGGPLAGALAKAGRRVALVERENGVEPA